MKRETEDAGQRWVAPFPNDPSCKHDNNLKEFYHFVKVAIENEDVIDDSAILTLLEEYGGEKESWTDKVKEDFSYDYSRRFEIIHSYLEANGLLPKQQS